MNERYYWGDVLTELRGALIRSENDVKKKLSDQRPDVESGIWIEQLISMNGPGVMGVNPMVPTPSSENGTPAEGAPISLVCRAVDLAKISGDASANTKIAYAVENQLKACPDFDPKTTQLSSEQMNSDNANDTFSFGITVTLVNPLKL
jgi:hypothetical protein